MSIFLFLAIYIFELSYSFPCNFLFLSIFLPFFLSIFLTFFLSIFLPFFLSIFLPFFLSIFLLYLSTLSFYPSNYLSIYLGRPEPRIAWYVNNREVEGGPTELQDLDVVSTFDFGTLSRQVIR